MVIFNCRASVHTVHLKSAIVKGRISSVMANTATIKRLISIQESDVKAMSEAELAKRTKLTVGQIGELREIFRLVDSDHNESIDRAELRQLIDTLRIDVLSADGDQYVDELIAKVKRVVRQAMGGDSSSAKDSMEESVTFEQLLLSLMVRPGTLCYTREELRAAFQTVQGKAADRGIIHVDRLSRAMFFGAGGLDADTASDIMSMVGDGQIGGRIDYEEIIDLMMGAEETSRRSRVSRGKRSQRRSSVPNHGAANR